MFDVNFEEEFKIITKSDLSASGERLRDELADLDFTSHYAIFSSGTSSRELKGYILSEKAMEANAHAVNEWFGLTSSDVWGLSLPVYHVGGLSVLVRARLLGNKVIDLRKWEPRRWYQKLIHEGVTVTTIVPTQLYDLVKEDLMAPTTLRYLIVGGDFLATELEKKARSLGWPVIRTYGMTEVCSQLASGRMPGDVLRLLPVHDVRTEEGLLLVKTPTLFTAVFTVGEKLKLTMSDELLDKNGFYPTQDRAIVTYRTVMDRIIQPLGRLNQEIKVGGHLTNVLVLRNTLSTILMNHDQFGKAELTVENDERKGNRLVLTHQELSDSFLIEIKEALKPAVLDEVRSVKEISRTDLGKAKNY